MAFADLKNDFVFRRIFATHADLLCSLLNDLLERSGEHTIETIEYLPSEQLPLAAGAKLSILDVRCKDRSGTTFVVEMQLIHVEGFINRVVYNACKAYPGQLQESEKYVQLTDVVAISICDFELWPDDEQRAQGLPLVPMLSRWHMTERKSGNHGLLQVQYVFLELPKLPRAADAARRRAVGVAVRARPRAARDPGGPGRWSVSPGPRAREQGDVHARGARRVSPGDRRDPPGAGAGRRQVARGPGRCQGGCRAGGAGGAWDPGAGLHSRAHRSLQGPGDARPVDRACRHGGFGRGRPGVAGIVALEPAREPR
ncbi:MAG TPA: Rpn family recombination-promoting nuclease/putative transposase [Kofleriaceae bacterium]